MSLEKWRHVQLTNTQQWAEADLPSLTKTPDLVIRGLHGLQDLRLSSEDEIPAKHVKLHRITTNHVEASCTLLENLLVRKSLEVLSKETDAKRCIPLWEPYCWQCAL